MNMIKKKKTFIMDMIVIYDSIMIWMCVFFSEQTVFSKLSEYL